MLQKLALTCHSAFEALGQHESLVLRRQNEAMRVELFNTMMPTFETVVRCFNDARGGPQCTCSDCQHMGLIHQHWHDDWQGPCTLWPAWEALLLRLNISVDAQLEADLGILVPWWDGQELATVCPELRDHEDLCRFFSDNINDPFTARAFSTLGWEDAVQPRSEAAVTQWTGRWTHRMHVVGAWGRPARAWEDPRIAEWTRLLAAVRELHFPARVTPTLGEFVVGMQPV